MLLDVDYPLPVGHTQMDAAESRKHRFRHTAAPPPGCLASQTMRKCLVHMYTDSYNVMIKISVKH